MDGKKKNSVKWVLITGLTLAMGIGIGTMIYIYTTVNNFDLVFAKGVSIQNITVGGLTKEEAKTKLSKDLGDAIAKKSITLKKDDTKKCTIPLKELGVTYDFTDTLEKAFKKGHEGNLFERFQVATDGLGKAVNFELTYSYDNLKIEEGLNPYKEVFLIPAIDATIERKNKQFIITPEQLGEEMAIQETAVVLSENLEANTIEEPLTVILKAINPKYTAAQLQMVQMPISSFYTSYDNGDQYRNANLKVAAKNINEVLKPGETFSLGEHLEPITYDAGYRPSKVIVNGKLEDGIGGGVCQIASTLYNAVLLSNLEITVRQNHSLPVAYVPLGRDATYATDSIDFRFKNNSKYPVFIESYCENNKVYVNIFGHESVKPTFDEIKFQSDTVETIPPPATQYIKDPHLLEGKKVQDTSPLYGKKVKLYKLYYNNGKLVNKEYIDQSYYRPRAEVIKVGTKPAAVPPLATPPSNTVSPPNKEEQSNEAVDLNNYTPE